MNSYLKKTSIGYLLLGLVFCGCYRNPNKDMAQLMDPISVDTSVEKALASKTFEAGTWPDPDWWTLFQDTQLTFLIERAIQMNPTLQKTKDQIRAAEQNAKKIRSKLFPTLDADYDENWQYFSKNGFIRSFYPLPSGIVVPATANQIDFSLNFNYEFDFWGKNQKMFKSALGLARADRAENAQAQLSLCAAVAFAYFEMQTHWTELKLYEKMVDLEKQKLELRVARRVFGIDTQISPLETQESLFSLEQTVSKLNKELLLDQYMLKMLVAAGPDAQIPFSYTKLPSARSFGLPERLGTDLLARRPDLMAQIWRVEAASLDIGVAKTDFYPNVNLMAFAGLESLSFNKFINWQSKTGGLNPAVHLPLFTGGRLRANLSQKVFQFNMAVDSYNELVLRAVNEVASELATLQSLEEQLLWQRKTLQAQEAKDLLMTARFEKGVDTYLSVISSREEMLNQEIREVELQNFRLLSLVRLIKSLGGGYHSDKPQPYKNKG